MQIAFRMVSRSAKPKSLLEPEKIGLNYVLLKPNTAWPVLIIVGDAAETLDSMYPYYRLHEAGFRPVVAAPEKRRYQMVLHEVKPVWTITKEWEGDTIQADVAFSEIVESDYWGILFSGDRAPEYLRYDKDLLRATRYFFER